MLSKDAWRRRSTHPLAILALAALASLASCHRFDNVVYIPAPTPLFMEEGLRPQRDAGPEPGDSAPPSELPPPVQPAASSISTRGIAVHARLIRIPPVRSWVNCRAFWQRRLAWPMC